MSRQSVPVAALIVWVAIGVAAVASAWSLPIDDFWLSLASGRELAAGASVTEPLPFSWTAERADSINPQWGAQLILGGHGSLGIALAINATLIFGGLLITGWRATRRASLVPAAAAMMLALPALVPHLLARAQSFSVALLPLALLLLERFASRPWLPIAYGALMVGWANLHGAFVIGQLAAAAWLLMALRVGRDRRIAALTAVAALLAPFVNPAGLSLVLYAYAQPATDVVRAISVEWQPAWPWIAIAAPFWIILLLVLAGRISRRAGASPAEVALLVALALLAVSGIRHIPWFVLMAVPILATDIAAVLARIPRLAATLAWHGRTRRVRWALLALALLIPVFQLVRPELPPGVARLTPDAPVNLAAELETRLTGPARILNEQVWGGYLAYRFGPQLETAMDGRLEIRSRETWQGYFDVMHGDGAPATRLRSEGVGWAMLMSDRRELISTLLADGWTTVATSDEGVLLRSAAP